MIPTSAGLEAEALKPCPFCGRGEYVAVSAYEEAPYFGYTVCCSAAGFGGHERGCGASGGWGETPAQAITAWNRRSALIPPSRAVEPEPAATELADWSNLPKDIYVVAAKSHSGIAFDVTCCSVPMITAPEVRYVRADLADPPQAVAPTGEIVPAGIAELVSRHTAYTDMAGVSTRMGDLREAATVITSQREHIRKQAEDIMTLGKLVYASETETWQERTTDLRRQLEAEQATTALQKRMLDEAYVEIRAYRAALTSGGDNG